MERKFRSLGEPDNIVYVVTDDMRFDDYSKNRLSASVGFYETMGDGDVQHTPLGQVMAAQFTDFCASAASAILEGDEELGYKMGRELRHYNLTYAKVRATLAVKFKDKKQYYEKSEFKVSSSPSKRHDTRWVEVVEWMDGSFKATASLLGCFYGPLLLTWSMIEDLRDISYNITESYAPATSYFFMPDENHRVQGEADAAFKSLQAAAEAYDKLNYSLRCMNCYQENLKNRLVVA